MTFLMWKRNAHLFKYDTCYGRYPERFAVRKDSFMINGQTIKSMAYRDPAEIPWDEEGVDIVIESTGLFTSGPKAAAHLEAGAKKVIITGPGEGRRYNDCHGCQSQEYNPQKHHIVSNASCTTNCLAPPVLVIQSEFRHRERHDDDGFTPIRMDQRHPRPAS